MRACVFKGCCSTPLHARLKNCTRTSSCTYLTSRMTTVFTRPLYLLAALNVDSTRWFKVACALKSSGRWLTQSDILRPSNICCKIWKCSESPLSVFSNMGPGALSQSSQSCWRRLFTFRTGELEGRSLHMKSTEIWVKLTSATSILNWIR